MFTNKMSIVIRGLVCSGLVLATLAVLTPVTPTYATTLTVTTNADSGAGSLRQAIADAAAGDTITFAGDYTITLTSELVINKNLTIDGQTHQVIVSGNHATRVFNVTAGTVTFNRLTIADGKVTTNDCGDFSTRCGGGIMIQNSGVTVNVTNSTLSGNAAPTGYGGGIENHRGTLNVINSTLSGNWTNYGSGGAIENTWATLNVTNSTFSGNSTPTAGGGIYNSGTTTVRNSIIMNNSGGNCNGTIGGANNLANDATCGAGFANSASILLGTLGNYGGSTQTFPLLPGSSAINAGDSAVCAAAPVSSLDQRGVARPTACDVGAFESRGFTLAKVGGDNQATPIGTAFTLPLSVTLSETGGNALPNVNITFTAPNSGASLTAPTTVVVTTNPAGSAARSATANGLFGSYMVKASASGTVSVTFTLTNLKGTSVTSVTSSPNPSTFGQPVTFTANVTSTVGTPTGNITFTVDAANIVRSVSNGVATYVTNTLVVGTHSVTTTYSGDVNYNGSASNPYTHTVAKATTTTSVTSSLNPAPLGQAVTFTTTITSSSGTPTGFITLTLDTTPLLLPLNLSGTATYVTTTLSLGNHTVTAFYDGDASFLSSNSVLSGGQTVNDAPITGLIAVNSSPTRLTNSTVFTATIGSGTNVGYQWNFGDGHTASGATVSHTYTTAGTYTASVTATNSVSTLSAATLVTVTNQRPVANAGNNQIVLVASNVTLDGSGSIDPDGHLPLTYGWTQSGGPTVVLSSNAISQPAFIAPSVPTVLTFTLTVTDVMGLSSTPAQVVVSVKDRAITNLQALNSSPTKIGFTTAFTATIGAGSNVTYTWNFGDGQGAVGAQVTHRYTRAGIYTATVTSMNSLGPINAITLVTVEPYKIFMPLICRN